MRAFFPGRGLRSRARSWTALALLALLASCAPGQATPTAQPTPPELSITPTADASVPTEAVPIVVDEPLAGMLIASPQRLRGRLAVVPPAGGLIYRLLDAENFVLATGSVQTQGEVGQTGSFEAQVAYTALGDSPGMLQLVQRNDLAGPVSALGSQIILITENVTTPPTAEGMVSTGTPGASPTPDLPLPPSPLPLTPTPLPTVIPQGQTISITSPPPGTQVGSPMTVAGTTSLFPFSGNLDYRFVDAANNQIGQGSFPVGAAGQPTSFTAELRFNPPPGGGAIRLDLYDQDNTTGQVAAFSSLSLTVAAPQPTAGAQQISITSPPPNTTVGSPVVITGGSTRFPANGSLTWRMTDQAGNQLGVGSFAVSGSIGQPSSFTTSLIFNQPPGGGPIRLELSDRDATTGQTIAISTLDMLVAGLPTPVPQQSIRISSPPPGTQVGSPLTITGSTVNFPANGNLGYRIFDAADQQIGVGAFPVAGTPGQAASFTGQLNFALPLGGGDIRVELLDRDDVSGNVLASSSVALRVAPPPVIQPPVPPTPIPPTIAPVTPAPPTVGQQEIQVTTPVSGTTVSAPLAIAGTLALPPQDGNLFYSVRDAAGVELGSGTFNVLSVGNGSIPFAATLQFTAPPAGTLIRIELVDQSERERVAPRARTEVRYTFQPSGTPR
ncbi:MAG: hypothetical protein H7Z42_08640 [Roseiflexaceae bacterium]|nr:hypothetical protein [Roseiflexaceae bacterium]